MRPLIPNSFAGFTAAPWRAGLLRPRAQPAYPLIRTLTFTEILIPRIELASGVSHFARLPAE